MITRCPAPSDLLLYALQLFEKQEMRHTAHHVNQCASCRATIVGIREVASVLQSSGGESAETKNCLDETTVANIVDLGVNMTERADLVPHLAACSRCREQVASVARLLRDSSIAAEIARTESSATPVTRRWRVAGAGALTALAAGVLFMVAGFRDRAGVTQLAAGATDSEAHREQSVTTTVAPSLVFPIGAVAAADTFRWTSVPHADRYRLTVHDREGTVVWEADGSDTAMAAPAAITRHLGTAFLWKVEARTGWDRWVSSDLIEFSFARTAGIP